MPAPTSAPTNDDTAAVGSRLEEPGPSTNADSGCAYIFDRSGTTWSQTARLVSAVSAANDALGSSVAIDGDYLAAGAPNGAFGAGYVAIFHRVAGTWTDLTDQFPITPLYAGQFDAFGTSVSLQGAILVGGAPGNDDVLPLDSSKPQSGNAACRRCSTVVPG